jgi:DNA repair protein RadC
VAEPHVVHGGAPDVAHAPEPLYARVRREDPERLGDADLLGVLLGSPRARSAEARALRLLGRFGTLRRLACATPGELVTRGVPPAAAVRIAAAFALGRRAAQQPLQSGAVVRSSADIFERFRHALRDVKRERFLCVLLDAKNRVMREEVVSEGGLTSAPVHPREVFATAIREHALSLVLVHNHPSGDPEPSPEDHEITRRLVSAGDLLGIHIADHIVIGEGRYVSFLERGWI